ncbi:hypothetical protein [Streptomyces sp. NRRL F-4489]|uniref:hypothetical protein n=1 Tax=Streptomyces sp. NRRL F-4489 TaxID=1609095 RepID=UPI00131B9D23|nr:hypothetical protein [Streptomyces sp. NRRL F-4489]
MLGVVTEPAPPGWWKANRHKFFGIAGLLTGYWIGTHLHGAPDQRPPGPRPAHSAPASTAPGADHGTHPALDRSAG